LTLWGLLFFFLGLGLYGCGGAETVKRPEFDDLSGRVSTIEDIVISRRAGGETWGPGGAPGAPTPTSVNAAPQASRDERARYNQAMSLLRRRDYQAAANSFASFLSDFPGGKLAPNARYWLGETYYARGDFQGALREFRQGFNDYPQSAKAPDCLLKMSYSLSKLGDGPGAMETLRVLLERYPNSNSAALVKSGRSRFPNGG
jgi:tol-pal system protein YbgF